ncbi:hypothetical protein P3T35_003463 [Kitasatospora sp. GP30]|uniref:hypothetical protein n=1 Tax=Kitasatospora sp. GP30 TaxID=3035084 RepID=UPI000CB665FD|nr:hypothetical protein [Kitasatospora sp. GP30]MDH6141444.1 hypothetical protein [Kitasatospora sp. GP30]
MQVQLAARAAFPDLAFAAATPEALVLLDGVTPKAGGEAGKPGCRHGTPWFVRRLGVHLLARLTDRSDRSIAECLADAIAETAALHGGRCDLADPAAPAAAVLAARLHGASLEYLLLGGPLLVLDTAGGPLSLRHGGVGRAGASPRVSETARTGFVRLDGLRALAALADGTDVADRKDGGGLLRRLAEGGAAAEPGVLLHAVC